MFTNGFPHFHLQHLRIYGVLQRIAVCYLIVGLLYLWDRRIWTKVALLVCLLIGYWVLVRWVPVPGAGVPGRDVTFLDKDQNIVAWLDRQLMPGHLYEDSPLHNARDPEGLLSDIPAIGTTLLGLLAGLWLSGWLPDEDQSPGPAWRRGGVPCLGISMGDLVPAQQENVDQLLCAGCSGMFAARVCDALLGDGAARMGQEAWSKAAGLAVAGLRLERHRGLHDQ